MPKSHFVSIVFLVACSLEACTSTPFRPLAPEARARLQAIDRSPASTGDQIYEGRVYALDGRTVPLFAYERWVRPEGRTLTSTHITRDATGAVVVVQSASHSRSYELQRADLLHDQSGVTASVVIAGGEATYTVDDGVRITTSRETVRDPVVAGPTMFGFILAHWDALNQGASLPIRFAVLERGQSLGFVLSRVGASEGRTVIRMTPSSPLVRLAVSPTYFQFDSRTRQILEYTGRVPPFERQGDRLAALDARVTYRFVDAAFR